MGPKRNLEETIKNVLKSQNSYQVACLTLMSEDTSLTPLGSDKVDIKYKIILYLIYCSYRKIGNLKLKLPEKEKEHKLRLVPSFLAIMSPIYSMCIFCTSLLPFFQASHAYREQIMKERGEYIMKKREAERYLFNYLAYNYVLHFIIVPHRLYINTSKFGIYTFINRIIKK